MTYENKPNTGAFFKSDKKTEDHPDYTGPLFNEDANGNTQEWRLAGWIKKSAAGQPYMSLELSKKGEFGEKAQAAGYTNKDELDDIVPF